MLTGTVPARVVARARSLAGRVAVRAGALPKPGPPAPIKSFEGASTEVARYWTGHTVNSTPFLTAGQSLAYLEWRFAEYPLFREFSGLYGSHTGEVVVDYGCGPGNDLTGFAVHSNARKIIGIDVSRTALELARSRLALHHVAHDRLELIQIPESTTTIPLEDGTADYLQAQGVLQHTSDPAALLREFRRVVRPSGQVVLMVYNADSIWRHLYVAYDKVVVEGQFAGLSLDEAFRRSTDGEDCPISRCWAWPDFIALCGEAGFDARYAGGYLSRHELARVDASWARAIADDRLGSEQREFLRGLRFDRAGYPMTGDFHAGIGGTYHLTPR
jgi:SAM-dependent methyltransferase